MKLVVVSTLGAVHRYVISEIARVHPPALVIQPVALPPKRKALATRLRRLRESPGGVLREAVESRVRRARIERQESALESALFDGAVPVIEGVKVPVVALHAPPTVDLIQAAEPDVLLVSGAPVLRPEIFGLPRLAAINIHYGVAPDYRGEDTLFWALANGDHDRLGLTIHAIERGVDSGRVFVQGTMARRGGESETELWASAARLASRLAIELLGRMAKKGACPKGAVQPPGGRQFYRRERTVLAESRLWIRRALGASPPPAAERVIWS